ncbi:MAG: hypothetical protein A3G34_07000 [Candidatus Lindowbacteria bacterium RIFCSPLOWO2_12_FULL_62_27]|nr:MAG: hypothetical protein A3G34_07000 [Candidatus Lindowbacteria bacterium RIFCSPLOWO2_12_FULL_62_27]OGH61291.1 MAG: hypothetical protein A3I06_03405 [Candidatus Lindowbacteria bacterium RIFCSPLOWO2_02_FULL_62_12]
MSGGLGRFAAVLPALLATALGAPSATAEPLNRKICALYNSEFEATPRETRIHRHFEMVLNHYGFDVDYYDIAAPLPDSKTMAACGAVVTWFNTPDNPSARALCRWLTDRLDEGKKLMVLENLGVYEDRKTGRKTAESDINGLLGRMGLVHSFESGYGAHEIEIEIVDTAMAAFERSLVHEVGHFEGIRSTDPANKTFLRVSRRNPFGGAAVSDAIVTTPRGGMAGEGYVYYEDEETGKRLWRLNPFLFVREALRLDPVVAPDIAVRNGKRIFYSHIDGDGFNNLALHGKHDPCSKIILGEILDSYLVPISVSVITAEIMPEYLGSPENVELARKIFRRRHVEPASHTFTHPLVWAGLDRAGGEAGRKVITEYGEKYVRQSSYILRHVRRIKGGYAMNNEDEIKASVDYINAHLAPPEKKTRTLFWSGDCLPDDATLGVIQKHGLLSINGAGARFDAFYPSYMYVSPIRRQVGPAGTRHQYYASNLNENVYTNLWTGPFHGFQLVLTTFARTWEPIRLRPINVYYHFYSAERIGALNALKKIYDGALAQDIYPMFTSEYILTMHGFFSTRIDRQGPLDYSIRDNGGCRTIRFERLPPGQAPDLARSAGLLGYKRDGDLLYAHLDESPEHRIVFGTGGAHRPYLVESSAEISRWSADGRKIRFDADIKGRGRFRIAVPGDGGACRVSITPGQGRSREFAVQPKNGVLAFEHDPYGRVTVEIFRP